jgi:hypothetical protein
MSQTDAWLTSQENRLREVETKLAAHEAVCAERYEGIRRDFQKFHDDMQDFKSLLSKVGLAMIAGMAGILVKLVFFV